ncbi:MAG: LPXTG cell wall anchor domain-containing protein [Bacteroidaceae bacterium]|nr:LPXTG cell wall anchor domain-containing protein [Bacteroidaceae bacterium]
MFKKNAHRGIAMLLTLCMVFAMLPMNVIALGNQVGDTATTPTKEPPAPVEGAVWVLTDSIECKKIVHTHEDKCYYKSCDHSGGHLSTCFSESTAYALCEHATEDEHTGSVTINDVVTYNVTYKTLFGQKIPTGITIDWTEDHPAYGVVKAKFDELAGGKTDTITLIAVMAQLINTKFCYTTSASATPDLCTHGECSDVGGACYTKICILEEHQHEEACFQYTWTLKSDVNKNGIADDVDTYYVVKYVNDGEVVYEKAILVGMPTPTVETPTKAADAQYTYTFVGWDTPVAETVTESVTYTAVYNNTVNTYKVTWLDENGKELEVDDAVEYGAMPSYDGETPTKAGDNTIKYTFAGWTPAVDKVTGDVTYTATYSTQDIFAVKFMIDGELQKTEYVVDGESVAEYAPTRAHYELTQWKNGEELYDFTAPVTGHLELNASWTLVEAVVSVQAPNAAYSWNGTGVYPVGKEVKIELIPQDGYFVKNVLVNGESVSLNYDDGKATVQFTPDNKTEKYLVKATVVKGALVLNSAEMNLFGDLSAESIYNAVYNSEASEPTGLKFSDVTVEYLAYSIELLGQKYEWWVTPGTDVSLEKFLNQYGLGALAGYIPVENLPHAFGAQSVEQVKVSYAGNDKYPALSAQTTVALIDSRLESEVKLNEKVSVVYGATLDEIKALVFNSVVSGDKLVTNNADDVTASIDSLNAGTRKVVVSFPGNNEYAASVAEVEITIEKAAGKVEVNSTVVKYGETIDVSKIINANSVCIEVLMGMQTGDNASADAKTVVYVNLPELIDMDSIDDETVKTLIQTVLDKATEAMSGTMTVAELKEALEAALPYIESAEDMGYETNIDAASVEMLIMALNELSQLEGVNEMEIKVSIGDDLTVSDAGVYLVAGITSDANYTTAFGVGYAVVTPDGYKATLDWTVEDENGIITIEALKNGYDLSAIVSSVAEGNVADAEAHMYTYFMGVNKKGELVMTTNQDELDIGAYTEVAFIADFGNTMYYAEPIARSFIVAADVVNVKFIDENGKVNHDRIFAFGEDATMHAVAFDRVTGEEETDGTMTYLYAGVQNNGEFYRGTTAPTRPGTYTVLAVFIGTDEMTVGAAAAVMVIEPIDVDFSAEDNTVVYDGKEHNVIIHDNIGMNRIYVIADKSGNLNVIVPNELHADTLATGATVSELLTKLEELKPIMSELPEIPEEVKEYYKQLSDAVKDIVNQLKKEYNVKFVSMNAPFPVEVGVYEVYVIGYKDAEHKIATANAVLTITCAHVYDNDCDETCNECGEIREVNDHVYDHACDEECNICGETRTVEKHKETYIDRYESTCVKQGYEKVCCKACHEVLSKTKLPLSEEHVYHNNVCLLCGAEEHCTHNYVVVRELEPTCGEAGYVWKECSKCGAEKNHEVGEPTGEHKYDNACDAECNVCGATREVDDHVYDNACDKDCNHCGESRTPADHVYDDMYDPDCNVCGAKREVPERPAKPCEHEYDNDCDAVCNKCEATREVKDHVYDNDCDKDCNVCGATREVAEHVYDNACDASCNVCGAERETAGHVYDDEYDATCNICGAEREVPEKPGEGGETPPQTGDNSNLWLWIIIMLISGGAIVFLMVNRKKATYNGKYSG